jgi:prophage antirepressor-like protein
MKDKDLITFTNEKLGDLRGFMKDGEPWFLAGQVCNALGIKDARKAIFNIREHYKNANIKGVHDSTTPLQTGGGKQSVLCIDEQFLYELVFSSKKLRAIEFRAWVTGEVLPALRKHGEYRMAGKLIRRTLTDEIVKSGENERMHGHGFSTYSILINKSLGLPNKNNKDELPEDVIEKIATRENTVKALLAEGKSFSYIKQLISEMSC